MSNIKITADLRPRFGTVRDQGARSSCLACATTDAHAHCHSLAESLSIEFLFYQAGLRMPNRDVTAGLTFDAVDEALQADGQPLETEWPYQQLTPTPWQPPTVTQRWYGALVDPQVAGEAIDTALQGSVPVVLGLRLTAQFLSPLHAPFIIPGPGPGFGGHALLAVGLGEEAVAGPLILVRNSWGDQWGWAGHAWLARSYLDDKLIGYRRLVPH